MPAASDAPDESMPVLVAVLGDRTVAIPAAAVHSVLPRPRLAPNDGGPGWLAGLMDWHGSLVPVVDGSILLGAGATPARLGSRIVLLEPPAARTDGTTVVARFGLLCSLVRERAMLAVGRGAWKPGEDPGASNLLSLVGRIGPRAVPLLDPARIVARTPALLPATEVRALAGGDQRLQAMPAQEPSS